MDVVELCRALVRIDSPSGGEGEAAGLAARAMADIGMQVSTDRYGSVLGVMEGARPGPAILLDAHLDTAPVTTPGQWQHPPLGGELDQGRVWGRGAADTKGSLAAMLCAAARLAAEPVNGRVMVSASVCEENATGAALDAVLDHHPAGVIIAGEPTGLRLGVAQKGRAGLVVEARGKSAHSSRPELGENAVYKMIEAVQAIRTLPLPHDPDLGPGVCELIEMVSEPLPGAGMIPHRCRARLALRLLPGETATGTVERIRSALEGIAGVSVDLDTITARCYTGAEIVMADYVPAWKTGPAAQPWQARIERGLASAGLAPQTFAAPYSTNASAGAGRRGIPTFILGPGSIEQAHCVDEWIAVSELQAGVEAYVAAIRSLATSAALTQFAAESPWRSKGKYTVK